FLPVMQSSDATTTGYTIEHNQQELSDLQAQIYATEAAIAQLGSMSRIQAGAAKLGMATPSAQPVAVTVNVAPSGQLLLPRRFLPPPPPAATPSSHSVLTSLLHVLALR
ncbi:MAG TPA: hypothetical protein VFA70_06250, partial [Dehalococcoidia bacterium]|nr:hypothetical protein [Dehalococcoidia bacterium]